MTHGFLSLTIDRKGNHQFEFLRYQRDGEGKFTLLSAKTTVERLRQAADDIGQYVSHVIRLFERIYREKKLEPKPEEVVWRSLGPGAEWASTIDNCQGALTRREWAPHGSISEFGPSRPGGGTATSGVRLDVTLGAPASVERKQTYLSRAAS